MIDAKSTILFPPLSFLKEAPFVTMFSRIVENNILVTYPITLYTREDGKMNWLGFLYTFLFTGKNGKRVSFVSYPLCFDDNHKKEVYQRLLKEAEELATAFKASRMVYEGYQCVTGDMILPFSGIIFGNTVNPDFLEVVKENQFVLQDIKHCYEIRSGFDSAGDVTVYTVPDLYERRQKYLELCSACDSYPQTIDINIRTQPPGIMDKVYFNQEWVLFTESQSQKGCIRWVPQSLFDKEKKGAKIVRTLFYNASSDFIRESVTEALKKIFLSGITRIQVADVLEGSVTESVLKNLGVKVYETVHMVKQYESAR